MGFVFSKLFKGLFGSEQVRIIIIGLDNAGKTTILCKIFLPNLPLPLFSYHQYLTFSLDRLHLDEVIQTVPSKPPFFPSPIYSSLYTAVGFNVETVNYKNLKF